MIVCGRRGRKGDRLPDVVGVNARRPLQRRLRLPLAAVDRGVANVLALDDVDNVFRDVGGVVADALEIFGH